MIPTNKRRLTKLIVCASITATIGVLATLPAQATARVDLVLAPFYFVALYSIWSVIEWWISMLKREVYFSRRRRARSGTPPQDDPPTKKP
jgi:hypothetical protein